MSERVWRSARRASFVVLGMWLAVVVVVATTVGGWTLFVTVPLSVPVELGAMYVAERAIARRHVRNG